LVLLQEIRAWQLAGSNAPTSFVARMASWAIVGFWSEAFSMLF
jgi:hypothetical protein